MLYYLLACFCSILSYDLARSLTSFPSKISLFQNNQLPIQALHMFWYCDIIILFLVFFSGFFIYKFKGVNVYKPKFYFQNRKIALLLLVPIIASNSKSFLANSVTGDVIIMYSLLTPFIACFLSYIILKEKLPSSYIKAFVVASAGFILTKFSSVSLTSLNFNILLFFYVFINAFSVIAVRYASLSRNSIEGIFVENLIYAAQGVIFFIIFGGFEWKYLFSWQALIVAIPSIIHHIFIIIGNQKSKYTAGLLLIDFLKVGIVYTSTYIFFGKSFSVLELVGIGIICISVLLLKKNK